MSGDDQKTTALAPLPSSALSRAGSDSLVQRGVQDWHAAREDAERCFKRGLELEDQGQGEQPTSWYRTAADQGHASAQHYLGWAYECGCGVPEDDEQAVFWYRKAANQGDPIGQFMLATMLSEGRGVSRDPEQAVSWYGKAADQGDYCAKGELRKIFDAGVVPKDLLRASIWCRAAEAAEAADRIPPSHLWQGREDKVLVLETPRGIEKWQLVDGRPRFLESVREKDSAV